MRIKWKIEEFKRDLNSEINDALDDIGDIVQDRAKSYAPVKSGALRNSIRNETSELEQKAYIGSDLDYSVYIELGTRKMAPRSYLRTALNNSHTEIENRLKNLL